VGSTDLADRERTMVTAGSEVVTAREAAVRTLGGSRPLHPEDGGSMDL
jgi:hypothetical protein